MSNVLIEKDKLDVLATAISNKSGEPLKLTLAEMVEAVDGIETGGGGITPTGNIDITQAGVTDVTEYATATVPTANPWIGYSDTGFFTENNQRKWHTRPVVSFDERQVGWMDTDTTGNFLSYVAVPSGTTVTPTESAQTIGGSNYMMQGAVTVNPIPSQYIVPSGTKSITENGTGIDVTEFASVDVSVSGGGGVTVTDEANATGITCVITTGSAPSETWETVFDGTAYVQNDTPYNYIWVDALADVYPTVGSVWRITVDGVNEYRCTAYMMEISGVGNLACVGNPLYSGGSDDGSGVPFNFYNAGWGAWVGDTELTGGTSHHFKIERLVEE